MIDLKFKSVWSSLIGRNAKYNVFLGTKVTRAAADIFDGTQKALFTVATGRILLLNISIEVVGADIDATASNTKIVSNPTVGTDLDLCAVLDITGDEEGTIYSISGVPTDALTGGSGGGANCMQQNIIVPEGTIDLSTSADAASSGGATGKAEIWYISLDDNATVTAT